MLIWPKYVVVGLCCLISSDGSIRHQSGTITISASSEKEWLKQIKKTLRNHKIGTSIQGPSTQNTRGFIEKYESKSKGIHNLMLNKRYPKGRPGGLNQHQVFRNSIEHWGVQDYLMNRKYEMLCKLTEAISPSKARIQTSIL